MKHKFSSMGRVAIALVLALSLSLVMAVPVSAATLTDVVATPVNTMAGATTDYDIDFTVVDTDVVASVDMEFDTGFNVSSAALVSVNNIGAGTVSSLDQVVTYTVTAPEEIATTVEITITLSGIVNPSVVGPYDVTVRTKDGLGDTIDQGVSADVDITAPPSGLKVEAIGTIVAGTAFKVRVTALEADLVTTEDQYVGNHLINFSSTASDPKTIPTFAVIDFTGGEGDGIGDSLVEFVLNKVETGTTITASDSAFEISGESAAIVITLADLTYLTITEAPASVTAGVAFADNITVTAYDAEGNVMATDDSVVSWTSTDGSAVLPDDHALAAGTYTFDGADFTLKTAGAQTITAESTTGPTSKTSDPITVNPAAASKLRALVVAPDTITADGSHSSIITATVEDEFGNVDTNYTESVTFTTSLGDLSGESANFVSGVATATLTSTDVGTATIKVTSGSFAYVTETVSLLAYSEVWVSKIGHDTNGDGTEALPYLTIDKGNTEVLAGGTVNVTPGTYEPSSTLTIATPGVTLQSTNGATVTFIDSDEASGADILITASNVTVDGFTVEDPAVKGIEVQGADATVVNNVITSPSGYPWGIWIETGGDGATVSGNVLGGKVTAMVHNVSDCTLSGNTFGAGMNIQSAVIPTTGIDITGNFIIGSETTAIVFDYGSDFSDILIEGNTISLTTAVGAPWHAAIAFSFTGPVNVDNLQIIGNDITDNLGPGIVIPSNVILTDCVINNNNITGNASFDLQNLTYVEVDAESNWWGTAVESAIAVSVYVDYSPWLDAPYPYGEPITTDSSAIAYSVDLATGWNLISLPLIPTNSDIDTVLAGADVTVNKVAYYTGGTAGSWLAWFPPPTSSNLDTMNDGKGYWVDVSVSGTFTVIGVQLALPGQAPPSYDLVAGWNLIGYSDVTAKKVQTYLGSVLDTVEAMYFYDASTDAYSAVIEGDDVNPGIGYWLAVSEAGEIFP